ncbi:MAG: hypothetical protein BHW55_06420 [Candidatus Melainabacteria bacterium 35_41]|nr:MAG: hypothetical protein BHW55_06420 [Candidatus Melainabacteria bacterium 35_41]
MYFPYLRGRQFELIALRELLERDLIKEHIFPVIEPVKLSSTLIKTLNIYKEKNANVAVIYNPCVGSLDNEQLTSTSENSVCNNLNQLSSETPILKAYHLSKNLQEIENNLSDIVLIANNRDMSIHYNNIYKGGIEPRYTLMLDESDFRRNIRNRNRVLLADNFIKKSKNADYNGDEFYTRDHLFYQDDGYVGFADYSVVGNDYTESGFAPYAVAIHIVYLDEDNTMRIHHFVSDSNDDYSDTTGKFSEALEKLIEWNEDKQLDTFAMAEFQRLYNEQSYPGLGTVKKLSIMHHIELVNNFLAQQQEV